MKVTSNISIFIILLFSGLSTFAHQDFYVITSFGKIKTRIKTGYEYEEIQKVKIIGELANKLAEELNYNKPILLDFNHFYVGVAKPTYFLSFDNGMINSDSRNHSPLLKEDAIVVRQVGSSFNILRTIKMLEYAIINRKKIKENQKKIDYNNNYCNWIINSIETKEIKNSILNNESKIISKIKNIKVYRPEKKNNYNVTYFWKNENFHIIKKNESEERTLIKLNNVYDFQRKNNVVFIFETNKDFHVLDRFRSQTISQKWKIKDISENYKLFKIEKIYYQTYTMKTNYYSNEAGRQPKQRTLIYSKNYDNLIQDLDLILKK